MYKTQQNKSLFAILATLIFCLVAFLTTCPVVFAASGNVAKIGTQEYATLADAVNQSQPDDTIVLIDDVVLTSKISISKKLTLDLNGKVISTDIKDSYGTIYVGMSGDLTIEDSGNTGTIVNNNGGIVIGNYGSVTIKDGTITTGNNTDEDAALYNFYYNGSTYGTSSVEGGTINGCVWNCGIIDITGGTFAKGLDNSGKIEISGNAIVSGEIIVRDGSDAADLADKGTFEVSGGTFENAQVVTVTGSTTGSAPITNYLPAGTVVNTDSNGNQVIAQPEDCVAQIGNTKYSSFDAALATAENDVDATTIELLDNISLPNSTVEIRSNLTIDGNGYTMTACVQKPIRIFGGNSQADEIEVVFTDVTIYNPTQVASARAIETRGGYIDLTIDNSTLEVKGVSSGVCSQALTIGGNHVGGYAIDVNIVDSSIIDGEESGNYGYGIIAFNPVNLTVENSEIISWSLLYMKNQDSSAGSAGSVVTFDGCDLTSINRNSGVSNSFSAIVIEDDNVEINIVDTSIALSSTGDQPQYVVCLQPVSLDETAPAPNGTIINISGDSVISGTPQGAGIIVVASTVQADFDVEISGGSFDVEIPDEYLADGIVMDGNGNAVVLGDIAQEYYVLLEEYVGFLENTFTYSAYSQAQFDVILDESIDLFANASSVEEVEEVYNMLIAEVAQVEPVATADLRTGAIEQLDSILEGYSNKVYTKENQQLIDQAYADAQAEINNAVSKEAMDEIVAEFANEISQIEATSDFVVGLIFIACAVVAVGGLIFFIHMAGLPNINDPKPEDEE